VGNVYVIRPTGTFTCNVKIWGGSGGYANMNSTQTPGVFRGAAGGAVEGTVTFEMGQTYTIFAGGAGVMPPTYTNATLNDRAGGGGAASGIWRGNIFEIINSGTSLTNGQLVSNILLGAGGGAGASTSTSSISLPGAGGGQVGDSASSSSSYTAYPTKSTSGIVANSTQDRFYGQGYTSSPGGSGGTIDANIDYPQLTMTGGNSYISSTIDGIISSRNVPGTYGMSGLYDNSYKSFFGENGRPGRVVLYLDEYRTTSIVATGGTVTTVPIPGYELQYTYHTFTSNGRFTINSTVASDTVDVFVVAGGGGGADAGGGGGGVILRTGLQITTGNYLVHVGAGGAAQNTLSSAGIGGYWGGYPGDHSAFYNNQLNQYFPDNYCRLIYSFNTAVYFISAGGDDKTADGSLDLPFATIKGALDATERISSLIVYAVLPGTYSPAAPYMTPGYTDGYTIIRDSGLPRIWVCSPGKVNITFTNNVETGTYDNRSEPTVVLTNKSSAVYGAIFQRESRANRTNNASAPMFRSTAGLLQNCVITDIGDGDWALFHRDVSDFRLVNCVVYTLRNGVEPRWNSGNGEGSYNKAAYIKTLLLQNCAFNYTYTTALTTNFPTTDNVTANLGIAVNAATYKITNVTDRGVYAGPYGWGGVATKPESKAIAVTYVAPGGGGGGNSIASGTFINQDGGSSGGSARNNSISDPGMVQQYSWLANPSYSSYGYPGGYCYDDLPAGGGGGGGAAFPGQPVTSDSRISEGGLGIEWPYGSQTYYSSGGNGKLRDTSFVNYSSPVAHGAGRGGSSASNGSAGTVIVRYVTAGPYTPPVQFVRTENLVATGGNITIANGYKQHTFYTSGVFSICNLPDDVYIDIITVGGGGGGTGSNLGNYNPPGLGGDVKYQQLMLNSNSIYNYPVVIGAGGNRGFTNQYNGSSQNSYGSAGGISSLNLPSYDTSIKRIFSTGGGNGGSIDSSGVTANSAVSGTLITSGLFSDNTSYYGGGGGWGLPANSAAPGGIGGGGAGGWGSRNGPSGQPGTNGTGGGGGGGGIGGGYQYIDRYNYDYRYGYTPVYAYAGGISYSGNGGSGLVIIRYLYNPI
jgi:hypothetical protein